MKKYSFMIIFSLAILLSLAADLTFATDYVNKPDVEKPPKEIVGKDGAKMVLIPAGEFQMGDELDEMNWGIPFHTVYLDAFYMDIHPVTNEQYKKFIDATGHKAPSFWNDEKYNKPDYPVVGVSWYDAIAYAEWAEKRLPTEAEWEKAARGGLVGKKYVWGDEWPPPNRAGNFDDEKSITNSVIEGYSDGYDRTSPVGSFKPNGYGLYDMVGNVWEWCADWYDSEYYPKSPKANPKGPDSGQYKVYRGGAWSDSDPALRVAVRTHEKPETNACIDFGFRCVQKK